MSDEANIPLSKPTGSIILDNPQVFALLRSTIDDRVDVGIRERNGSLRNWFIGILIVLTAWASFTLHNYVDEAVTSAVEKVAADDRFNSKIAALNFRVLKLDLSDGFTNEEAESIILSIQSLTSKGDEQRLEKLAFALDTAVRNFVVAGRLDLAIGIERLAPDLFLKRANIVATMVQAFGFTLLADAGAPDSWTDAGSKNETYKNYRKYANRAELIGYRETYLLFEMLLGYIERRPAEVISNLIEETDSLSEEDADHFIKVMTSLAVEEMTTEPAKSKRVASRVGAFLCEYKEKGQLLGVVSKMMELQC